MKTEQDIRIAFFGSSEFSVFCLEEMKAHGFFPSLIISTPDKPVGRGLKLQANIVKNWAEENKINISTPNKLDDNFIQELKNSKCNLFLVCSYGRIIPNSVITLPEFKTLNIHPSLLPKYRGASPLQAQILADQKNIGLTLMQIDEQMDHGPIISQKTITIPNWPVSFEELEKMTAVEGIKMFIEILPSWIGGEITPKEQNHSEATYTKKIEKNDGLIDLEFAKPYENYLKTKAFYPHPGTFFFINKNDKKIRVIIKDSEYLDGKFIIKKVLPEGKKEMNYEDFLRGL